MTAGVPITDKQRLRRNKLVAWICVAFFGGMVGASYAAVPLYAMFCQLTGFGGTPMRVDQYSDRVLDRDITIRFDANTSGALAWEFKPAARSVTIKIGETVQADYTATNMFSEPSSGRATFNVTPERAGAYFNKVECFCFTDTTLKAGETIDMPVVFYVDPEIVNVPELKDIHTITLSYTFFPTAGEKPVAATGAARSDKPANTGGRNG